MSTHTILVCGKLFDGVGAGPGDYYPADLHIAINDINDIIYPRVNNGVYRAGFATSQAAYDEAVTALFETLEGLERRLGEHRYLLGNVLTEADLRLWTTLVRFDAVYVTHFKCDRKRIAGFRRITRPAETWKEDGPRRLKRC